ncbi:uncharacterized protein DS421_11g326090 [Arachis hypogaea]|nr:uncharacterized protein DS421_11g326090 [Arachis hypogaea]
MCVGRTTELIGSEHQGVVEKAAAVERTYKAKIDELERSVKERDDVVVSAVARAKESEEEVTRLRDQIRLLQSEVMENDVAKGGLTARVLELEENNMEMFSYGFDRAVSQISLLAPEFDIGRLDMTKVVANGKLVVDGTAEEHDENVPPPP